MVKPTVVEITKAEEDVSEAVKAALLISGADKTRFGRLKDELANNYLLGSDQYPDTYEKAMRILGNYQTTRANKTFRRDGTESGLAFIQRGGRGRGRGGRGGGAGRGTPAKDSTEAGGGDGSSALTGPGDSASTAGAAKVNRA